MAKSVGGYQIVDFKNIQITQNGVQIPGVYDTIKRCIENQKPVMITNLAVTNVQRLYSACSPCITMRTTVSSTDIEFSVPTSLAPAQIYTIVCKIDGSVRYTTFRPAEYTAG